MRCYDWGVADVLSLNYCGSFWLARPGERLDSVRRRLALIVLEPCGALALQRAIYMMYARIHPFHSLVMAGLLWSAGCESSERGGPELTDASSDASVHTDAGITDASKPAATACNTNADCVDSPEAELGKTAKCKNPEVFCSNHSCSVDCAPPCVGAQRHLNPCARGTCAPILSGRGVAGENYCTMLPVPCAGAQDCPVFIPGDDDAGASAWSCLDKVCYFPGYSYPTH
jgi:hypothetical protein